MAMGLDGLMAQLVTAQASFPAAPPRRKELTRSRLQRDIEPTANEDPFLGLELSQAPIAIRYLAALAMTAVATMLAVGFDNDVTIPNLSLIFVVPVIIAAVSFGLGPSLFSSILGALAYNFFLTDPATRFESTIPPMSGRSGCCSS
jgi:K+-sensing histidine kinase KdpD